MKGSSCYTNCMDKKTVLIVMGIVFLVLAALGYAYYLGSTDTPADESTVSIVPDATKETDDGGSQAEETVPGEYREYSEEAVLTTSGTKLLFFHAPWCPQCRSVEASIERDGLPENVTVFKVDYDSNQELRQRYGVTIQTTFVKVDDLGNKIDSYVAYQEPNFSSVERELLR